MAIHNRGYYREMRHKHICRKKYINHALNDYWVYKYDGQYSKGKIHCSCGMCCAKTRNKSYKRRHIYGNYAPSINYKHSDRKKIESMRDKAKEYNGTNIYL